MDFKFELTKAANASFLIVEHRSLEIVISWFTYVGRGRVVDYDLYNDR